MTLSFEFGTAVARHLEQALGLLKSFLSTLNGCCDASCEYYRKFTLSIPNNLHTVLNLSRLMTNVYGSAKNIPPILLLLHHLTIDRANNRLFPISPQLNRSEVPTFSPRVGIQNSKFTFPPPQGQKFCCKVPIKSPYSPTSALGAPLREANDKCVDSSIRFSV